MNTQPTSKSVRRSDGSLYVHSIFKTIQGEGPFAGCPAIFIRLAGCNLQCPLCDTDYTSKSQLMTPSEIQLVVEKLATPNKLVVLTGGEPLRQNIYPLYELLCFEDNGFKMQVETNGTFSLPKEFYNRTWNLSIICSPKTGRINRDLEPFITAYKYILDHRYVSDKDGLPFIVLDLPLGNREQRKVARPRHLGKVPIYVQPVDVADEELNRAHLKAAIDVCLVHGYTLCIQVHKIIGLE